MRPIYTKIVTLILIALGGLFLYGVFSEKELLESYAKTLVIPVFVFFYFFKSRRKNLFFGGFLSFLAIAEISKVYFDFKYDLFSSITNTFSIVAYLLFIFYIYSNVNALKLIRKYWPQCILLIAFSIYILNSLKNIMFLDDNYSILSYKFIVENGYNFVVLWLMCLSLLNFLYHDDKRSSLIFIIAIFFGLAEIVQVPYLFLSSKQSLHVVYSVLYFMGYYFVYLYVSTRYNKQYNVLT